MIKQLLYVSACIAAAMAMVMLAAYVLSRPASAMEQVADGFRLTHAEMARCQAGGGCIVIPLAEMQAELAKWLQKAFDSGRAEGCKSGA